MNPTEKDDTTEKDELPNQGKPGMMVLEDLEFGSFY
jgi:hypothetical protein